jgi:DNA-binding LacI/PurR family transcriptional regulator
VEFLRSKAEHLADHLREAIASGRLVEPLPNLRDWSSSLGVAHGTLEKALDILKREGLVRARPRKGIHLVRRVSPRPRLKEPPFVRLIEGHNVKMKDVPTVLQVLGSIALRLSAHGIRLGIEIYSDARLKTLHEQGERPNELLLFRSLPRRFQELFSDFQRSVLLLGEPAPGIQLPFITIDVLSAIRHAVFLLARRGFERIALVINESGRQPIDEEFSGMCAAAPRVVRGEVVRLPDELYAQNLAAQKLAARVTARQGLIVISPIHAGLLMMTVAGRGWKLGDEVEVIQMNAMPQEIRTHPIPIHYPTPLEPLSKAICHAAIHYFEQGTLPPLQKKFPLEMVSPPR